MRCTRTSDNLVLLSDAAALRSMGAADADIEMLTARDSAHVAGRRSPNSAGGMSASNGSSSPRPGFGSRGTYRGDKITRRAFGDVMRGDYIAQADRTTQRTAARRDGRAASSSTCATTSMTA